MHDMGPAVRVCTPFCVSPIGPVVRGDRGRFGDWFRQAARRNKTQTGPNIHAMLGPFALGLGYQCPFGLSSSVLTETVLSRTK
jgi:hypothetical protein